MTNNPTASAYTGHPTSTPVVHTAPIDVAQANSGPEGFDPATDVEVCPICNYTLPTMWRWGSATCVAMAGARYTGKTVFIAVLIKQLQRYAEFFHREVIPADSFTKRTYREKYERPLYEARGIVAPTPSAQTDTHNPLIFDIGMWDGVKRYLVIRDVAGEDLEGGEVGGPAWDFFAKADAVLFMFDPLRVDDVADKLRDLVPVSELGGDPREVLHFVMDLIATGNPRLGVILSKFDALQALSSVRQSSWGRIMSNSGAAFNRDPGLLSRRYDEADGHLLDAEVRSLLQRLHAGPLLMNMRNPRTGQPFQHRFFAVSALGESPAGEHLHPNGISPFRCLDPIRWIFADSLVLQE